MALSGLAAALKYDFWHAISSPGALVPSTIPCLDELLGCKSTSSPSLQKSQVCVSRGLSKQLRKQSYILQIMTPAERLPAFCFCGIRSLDGKVAIDSCEHSSTVHLFKKIDSLKASHVLGSKGAVMAKTDKTTCSHEI